MPATKRPALPLLIVEALLIIGLTELGIMLALDLWPAPLNPAIEAVLDVALLSSIAAPLLAWRLRVRLPRPSGNEHEHGTTPRTLARVRHIALALFTAGAALSLTLAWVSWTRDRQEGETRLDERIQQLQAQLRAGFDRAEHGLHDLAALHAALGGFTRQNFHDYWAARSYTRDYPGVRGFGYLERVAHAELDRYLQRQRSQHGPTFRIPQLGPHDHHYVATLVEPLERMGMTLGLDLSRDPVRYAAARAAVRSGRTVLTSVITLVQDERQGPGFILLLPLYAGGSVPETVDEREARHVGFVYSPMVARELIASNMPATGNELIFALYTEGGSGEDVQIFHSKDLPPTSPATAAAMTEGQFRRSVSFTIGERPFRLDVRSTPAFDAAIFQNRVSAIGIGGVLLSALLALVFWSLASARARAEVRALELTGELRRLARIAQRTQDAVIITDPEGRITWVNQAFTDISGYTLEEALGHKPGALLQCEQTDAASVAMIRDALQRRQSCQAEILNRHKDGSLFWLELEIQPLYDEALNLEGFMAVERDVTQRHEAQAREREHTARLAAALRETEALMNTINAHAIVSEAAPDGRIVRVNEAFCRISGYTEQELLGQNHRIINSGLHDRAFWGQMWRTIASGHPWRGQIRNRAKDGSYYWVDSIIAPFMDAQGRIEKYVSIRFDITRAHQAEEELARERQRLQTTLEGTNIGTWEVNVRTGENRIDERWAAMLGYTLQELMPMTPQKWRGLVHPDEESAAQQKLLDYLHGHTPYFEVERRLRHKDGRWIWVLSRGAATSRTPAGEVEWMAGTHMDVSERHALQEQIEQRNALMQTIIDNLPSGLSAVDGQLNLILHNRLFRELLDFPDELFTPEPVPFERIIRYNAERGEYGPGDPAALTAAIVERARHPVPHQIERTRPSGQVLDIRGVPLPGGGFVTTYTDITERRQAEREARQADEMLRQAIDALDEAFVIYDENDRLLLCNQRYRDTYPISAPMMRPGVSFEELLRYGAEHGEYAAAIGRVETWVAERLAQHRRANTDLVQELTNGRFLRIIERKTPSGLTVGFRIDVTDLVHARQAAEAATRVSEQALARLRAIYDILPVGLTITDPDGRIIDCNPASEKLLGISREEHLTRRHDDKKWTILREDGSVMPPEEYPAVVALQQRRAVHNVLMQVITAARAVWLRVSAMPMASEGLGVVVAYFDVTEGRLQQEALREAMQRAEEASRAKSQFLANMSHEIRTPMNAILGMLSLLQATPLSPRQQDYVSKTEGAARALLGLLNDILDFSKVEAGKMTLESAPIRLEALLRDLSVILAANIGSKPLEVLFDLDPRLPTAILGDSLRLKQVLINLGGNAIKFTERGTVVVRITVIERTSDTVELEFSVQDTGIGIAPQHLQRIFEGFSQAEASTTRRFGGTGLGLSISARLVALMGGQLQVQSEPGQGSRFYFRLRLPLAAADPPPVPTPQTPAGQPLRVLIIDDNPITRQVLQALAQSLGWLAEPAASGEEALALIAARQRAGSVPFDAIFVDWQMPGLDGWQTSLRIRQLLGDAAPILVMVTAHGREMLAQRPAQEQALIDGYVVKPITPAMLLEALQQARQGEQASTAQPASARPSAQRLQGLRILLVEDNPLNQQVARELLEREGAQVTVATDGAQGVQAIAQASPPWDVVLMDVQMPVMDGYAATRQVRERLGLKDLPIIAMTANAMESDRQDALAAGMNDHIGKPFDLDALVRTILAHSRRVPQADANAQAPTPAPAAPPATPLPDTPELELSAAVQRLGGDQDVLRQVLQSFMRELPRQLSKASELSGTGQLAEAARLLHTIKGASATVGATALARVAAEGETLLRASPAPEPARRQELLARLQAAAHAALAAVETALRALQALAAQPVPADAPAPLDAAALRQDLQELQNLLRQSDLASLDVYARIQQHHGMALGAELEALDAAMANLDFEQALSLCDQLQTRYTATSR